jgi:uncharacterized protein
MTVQPFELIAADGNRIKGDRADETDRQILFITGFLSKRWRNGARRRRSFPSWKN